MAVERILVVDDEEDLLELISYNLTKEGYRVTCVATGEEAINEAKAALPDLIVLDLLLPSVDGLDVCKRFKAIQDAEYPHRHADGQEREATS